MSNRRAISEPTILSAQDRASLDAKATCSSLRSRPGGGGGHADGMDPGDGGAGEPARG